MIDEAQPAILKGKLNDMLARENFANASKLESLKGKELREIAISNDSFDTFVVQMVALGIIEKSPKTRSVKDTSTYWRLSPYGERLMYELRAIPRQADLLRISDDHNIFSPENRIEETEVTDLDA